MTNLDQLPGHGFTLSLFPVKGEHDRRARARRRRHRLVARTHMCASGPRAIASAKIGSVAQGIGVRALRIEAPMTVIVAI
jgi:hypothetical protein